MNGSASRVTLVVATVLMTFTVGITVNAETSVTSLRHQTSKQLRLESIAKDVETKDEAAAALCDLYVVLRCDPRFAASEMLQGDATKVRRRLLTIARRREIQLERAGIQRPANLTERVETAIEVSLSDNETDRAASQTHHFGAAAGAAANNGWQLVELIQRIVAPDFWEPLGGAGSIHYFAMRRILVVRATTDVHQQVKDLLMALR